MINWTQEICILSRQVVNIVPVEDISRTPTNLSALLAPKGGSLRRGQYLAPSALQAHSQRIKLQLVVAHVPRGTIREPVDLPSVRCVRQGSTALARGWTHAAVAHQASTLPPAAEKHVPRARQVALQQAKEQFSVLNVPLGVSKRMQESSAAAFAQQDIFNQETVKTSVN